MESLWSWNFKPISICPLNRRVDAVYYDEPNLCRSPVLGIGIVRKQQVSRSGIAFGRAEQFLSYILPEEDYLVFSDENTAFNFIGYEFDGVQRDWSEAIERYKKKEAKLLGGNK